jgi:hypothetical protein
MKRIQSTSHFSQSSQKLDIELAYELVKGLERDDENETL